MVHQSLPPFHQLLLLSHLLIHAGTGIAGHIHIHEAESRAATAFILGRHAQGIAGGIGHGTHSQRRIRQGLAHLYFLDLRFIFFIGLDAVDAEGYDFQAAQFPPALGQDFIQGVGDFKGPPRQFDVVDTLGTELGEGRLQGVEQFRFQLAVDLAAFIPVGDVARYVGIEQDRVDDTITVFAKTAQADQENLTRIGVFHLERDFLRRAVLIADELFHVEVVDPLVLARIAAKGEAFLHLAPHIPEPLFEASRKDRRFCRHIVDIFARFVADVDDLARFDDHHALAVVDGNLRAVGNDIVFAARIGTAAARTRLLLPFHHEDVRGHTITIEKFLPLVSQDTAGCSHCRFDQTHKTTSFS